MLLFLYIFFQNMYRNSQSLDQAVAFRQQQEDACLFLFIQEKPPTDCQLGCSKVLQCRGKNTKYLFVTLLHQYDVITGQIKFHKCMFKSFLWAPCVKNHGAKGREAWLSHFLLGLEKYMMSCPHEYRWRCWHLTRIKMTSIAIK